MRTLTSSDLLTFSCQDPPSPSAVSPWASKVSSQEVAVVALVVALAVTVAAVVASLAVEAIVVAVVASPVVVIAVVAVDSAVAVEAIVVVVVADVASLPEVADSELNTEHRIKSIQLKDLCHNILLT